MEDKQYEAMMEQYSDRLDILNLELAEVVEDIMAISLEMGCAGYQFSNEDFYIMIYSKEGLEIDEDEEDE